MFDKLFGRGKKSTSADPPIAFGRYSDNNKSVEKTRRWTDADNLFKEQQYTQSIDAFFDYLRDDAADNVALERNGDSFTFQLYQGSKIVRGSGDAQHMKAEVSLARMPQPSVPVMRRLLEQNFSLYYSRYALDGERLCMRFDTDIKTANPNKLYYAFKELATRSDKQDDLLVKDFSSLQTLDTEHVGEIPLEEKETKFVFVQQWISNTLSYIDPLDKEKLSGGISYLLLALSFRIDYLVCPEGALQAELEKIPLIYFTKDERPAVIKNEEMIAAFRQLQAKPKEDFFNGLFRSKSTFAIVAPQPQKIISDAIIAANANMPWYRDNQHPFIGQQICEYGISFCQYSYSLPRALSELFLLLMRVNYSSYFSALGFSEVFYDEGKNKFNEAVIVDKINSIIQEWKRKHNQLEFKTQQLKFDNLLNFNHSFTSVLEQLNFEST